MKMEEGEPSAARGWAGLPGRTHGQGPARHPHGGEHSLTAQGAATDQRVHSQQVQGGSWNSQRKQRETEKKNRPEIS